MHDTVIRPSIEQQARLIQGHPDIHVPADWWDRDALAGAGGLRSTADDMLTYLEANLHPERVGGKSTSAATLATAIALSQEPQAAFEDMKIALGWLYDPESGRYWFDGATNGFSAYAFFDLKRDYAAVVLMNTPPDPRGSFVERLAEYIRERFSGEKAISLSYR
jgi:CubicO group peptidase (beta-lactamase class C family)